MDKTTLTTKGFDSVDLTIEVQKIGAKFNLLSGITDKLEDELIIFLTKKEPIENFSIALKEKVGISGQDVDDIIKEIKSEIIPKMEADANPKNVATSNKTDQHPDKDVILNGIENPAPARPIVVNPAGANPILDAQHNLPEGERRVAIGNGINNGKSASTTSNKPTVGNNISSSAVQSRGPLLGNVKNDPYREPEV